MRFEARLSSRYASGLTPHAGGRAKKPAVTRFDRQPLIRIHALPNDRPVSDDPGTTLDSLPILTHQLPIARSVFTGRPVPPNKQAPPPTVQEALYRSPYRYAAPRITICDDGSLEDGEVVYVRSDRIIIGRSKGDLLIPHDVAMSASHAEVARVDVGGKHAWVVRDLDCSNGTLVRCRAVTLRPGMTLLIGSGRPQLSVRFAVE